MKKSTKKALVKLLINKLDKIFKFPKAQYKLFQKEMMLL